MERLINADELIKHLDYVCTGSGLWSNILNDVIEDCKEFVNHEPTVDAVQVVRCKDCKHGHECYGVGMSSIVCEFTDYLNSPNGFCHEGERKDSEHE